MSEHVTFVLAVAEGGSRRTLCNICLAFVDNPAEHAAGHFADGSAHAYGERRELVDGLLHQEYRS